MSTGNTAPADIQAAFPIGSRVLIIDPDLNPFEATVTGWREAIVGEWVVDVDGKYNGHKPTYLVPVRNNTANEGNPA